MSTAPPIRLRLDSRQYEICRLDPGSRLDELAWLENAGFLSATWTDEELSIVTLEGQAPSDVRKESGFRLLKVVGPLDFSLVGILAGLSQNLADAGVSIFALSTFDTDYLLCRADDLPRALNALRAAGYEVESP